MTLSSKVLYGCLITLSCIAVCKPEPVENCWDRIGECVKYLVPVVDKYTGGHHGGDREDILEDIDKCLQEFSCKLEDDVARKEVINLFQSKIAAVRSHRFKTNMAPTNRISPTIFVFACVLATLGITNI